MGILPMESGLINTGVGNWVEEIELCFG